MSIKDNATITYCFRQTHSTQWKTISVRGRVTPKQVKAPLITWDMQGNRVSAYRHGSSIKRLISYQIDGAPIVTLEIEHEHALQCFAVPSAQCVPI